MTFSNTEEEFDFRNFDIFILDLIIPVKSHVFVADFLLISWCYHLGKNWSKRRKSLCENTGVLAIYQSYFFSLKNRYKIEIFSFGFNWRRNVKNTHLIK